MSRPRGLLALALLAASVDAAHLAAPRCSSSQQQQTLLRLRGGADAAAVTSVRPWLLLLRRLLFPGNPARERAPYVPPPAAPPPAAKAAASGADAPFNRAGSGRRRAGGKAVAGKVTAINSKKDFDALLASTRSKQLVVVDFFATWCGPCQQIAPKYEAMAAALPQAKFVKVDVDQAKDLSQQYGVQSMPTFKLFRGGQVVDEMKGADENALKEKIEALAGKADRWAAVGAGKKL
jgi:thioredoxin